MIRHRWFIFVWFDTERREWRWELRSDHTRISEGTGRNFIDTREKARTAAINYEHGL